jgi:hypothetical protein
LAVCHFARLVDTLEKRQDDNIVLELKRILNAIDTKHLSKVDNIDIQSIRKQLAKNAGLNQSLIQYRKKMEVGDFSVLLEGV